MAFNTPSRGRTLVADLDLSSIVESVSINSQVLSRSVARLYFKFIRTAWNRSPTLIGVSSLVPLDNLRSRICLLPCNISTKSIQNADQHVTVTSLLPSPSLVESFVLFPLDQSFVVIERSPRNVKSLS